MAESAVAIRPIEQEDNSLQITPVKPDTPAPPLNNIDELRRLEKRATVADLLRTNEALKEIDTAFARKLSLLMINNPDEETAWKVLHAMEPTTDTQRNALRISEEEFAKLHKEARLYLETAEPAVTNSLMERTHTNDGVKGQILWNDHYELRQHPRRGLEYMRQHGVRIELSDENIKLLRDNRDQLDASPACPILEHIKNDKIFTISGFKGSKASLTIHDLFDHYWTYDKLDKEGIFERYKDFFDKVGNPQSTDIFKRESEMIATTVFGTRLYTVSEEGFQPIFDFNKVKGILKKSQDQNTFSDNQQRALTMLENLDPESYEAKSLAYVVSNMAIELMEQRRKHGPIKELERQTDETLTPIGVVDILDPEYIALMTDIHHIILDPDNHANETLLKISVQVEEYLVKLAHSEADSVHEPLVVKIEDMDNFDLSQSALASDRIAWLKEHAGFASTKSYLC